MTTALDASSLPTVRSPCINLCRLDDQGYCEGCRRTGAEIGQWRVMSPAQRDYVIDVLLPLRRPV